MGYPDRLTLKAKLTALESQRNTDSTEVEKNSAQGSGVEHG